MRTQQEIHQTINRALVTADHVPYSSAVAPHVIKLKNSNGYLVTFEMEGVDFETCGEQQIEAYKQQLHQLLIAFGGGQYALWTHKVRHRIHEQQSAQFDNQFCLEVANAYQEKLAQSAMMRTAHFLTVVYRPFEQTALKSLGLANLEAFLSHERVHRSPGPGM